MTIGGSEFDGFAVGVIGAVVALCVAVGDGLALLAVGDGLIA